MKRTDEIQWFIRTVSWSLFTTAAIIGLFVVTVIAIRGDDAPHKDVSALLFLMSIMMIVTLISQIINYFLERRKKKVVTMGRKIPFFLYMIFIVLLTMSAVAMACIFIETLNIFALLAGILCIGTMIWLSNDVEIWSIL